MPQRTPLKGLDYVTPIAGSELKGWGVDFVARYLSNSPWKNLTVTEAHDLSRHGIDFFTVWEDGAADAYLGYNVGRSHAEQHVAMAEHCGKGDQGFYYFAVDTDTAGHPEWTDHYFDGVASVIPKSHCGPYGGIEVVKHQLDRGFGAAWQTIAWSAGQRDERAQVYQDEVVQIGADHDQAFFADFGQWDWVVPPPPNVEHYERFLNHSIEIGRHAFNEHEMVLRYDAFEPHRKGHPFEHAMLKHDLRVLRDRVMTVAREHPDKVTVDRRSDGPSFDIAWRGWRWQQLNARLIAP